MISALSPASLYNNSSADLKRLQGLVSGQTGEQDHHSAHFTDEKVKPENGQLSSLPGGSTAGLLESVSEPPVTDIVTLRKSL